MKWLYSKIPNPNNEAQNTESQKIFNQNLSFCEKPS